MTNNNNEQEFNSENEFFSNNNVPYYLKAGAFAVLLHTTPLYQKNREGKDMFLAMGFDKNIAENIARDARRNLMFTFGENHSIAETNCAGSLKLFAELYPSMGEVFDAMMEKTLKIPDEEIAKMIADASVKRFKHGEKGAVNNAEYFVLPKLKTYLDKVKQYYPGMLSLETYERLEASYKTACERVFAAKTVQSARA